MANPFNNYLKFLLSYKITRAVPILETNAPLESIELAPTNTLLTFFIKYAT